MSNPKIIDNQLLSLYVGGRDGGIIVAASAAQTAKVVHLIQCLEDVTTFSVLSGNDQDDTARNLLTANGYAGVALDKGTLVFAPYGGKLTTFTADKKLRYFRMAASDRTQNN